MMDQDWDNLIILDACRYDIFEEINDIQGDLRCVHSMGSNSWEWVRKNFTGKKFHDTIYVTSNVHYMKLDAQVFHYSENINRVHPRQLIERATDLKADFPNKRFIVHMMVPHTPYHSTRARELRRQVVESKNIKFSMTDIDEDRSDTMSEKYDLYSLLNACERGYISDDELLNIYKENVQISIEYAKELIKKLMGKTIITSDHGELLGERIPPLFLKEYGHGEGIYHDGLRSVPYLIIDGGDRRHITSESPVEVSDQQEGELDARLRALGYK